MHDRTVPKGTLLGLRPGDPAPPQIAGPAALFVPGPRRWVPTCAPLREDAAEAWLSRRGVYAFHPVTTRQVPVRGRAREYVRRYVPGYVFACFEGEPIPHRVLGGPFLTVVLRASNGSWGILGPDRLRRLHRMRRRDEVAEQRRRQAGLRRQDRERLRHGDRALFRAGPFAEFTGEVVEVEADGGVKVRFDLLGSAD